MVIQPMGTWRSYMSFYFNGYLRKHSLLYYTELDFTEQGELTIASFSKLILVKALKTVNWSIRQWEKKRFLFMEAKKAFEIITLEPKQIVLADSGTSEKTFFVELSDWGGRLKADADSRH